METFNHTIEMHCHKELKIKCSALNQKTGSLGYQTKDFRVIPSEVLQPGETFGIIEDTWEIFIEADEFPDIQNLSIHDTQENFDDSINSPLLKKTKSSTPVTKPEKKFERQSSDCDEDFTSELIDMVPSVITSLKKAGHLETWMKLNRMISEDTFPFANIAFLLFMDVCKFLDNTNTSSMKYSELVKKFWRIGYRLFHGKWLKFMGGPKHGGMLIAGDCEKGVYDPKDSCINFAVPVRSVVSSKLSPVAPADVKPGILKQLLDRVAEQSSNLKTYKLCLDGKKINASTSGQGGEIDLWGNEQKPTLKERQEQLNSDKKMIEDASTLVCKALDLAKHNLSDLESDEKTRLKEILLNIITVLSKRVQILREVVVHREMSKERLINSIEGDWRKSRLVFVISGLITYIYDIKACIKNLLDSTDQICSIVSRINGSRFVKDGIVNMSLQENYLHLTECEIDLNNESQFRFVKQRSQIWHSIRNTARVTGSTINDAICLGTLKRQREHFDEVVFKKPKPEPSAAVKEKMRYGTDNERHAIATLVGKILPVYNPELKYVEEGCYRSSLDGTLVVISPDGSCRSSCESQAVVGIECKCPFPGKTFTTQVFYSLPKYYVTQVLSEMYALKTDLLYVLCYSEESTTVLKVTFDADLWRDIQNEIQRVYGGQKPIRPPKKSETSKAIQLKIDTFVERNVEFIAEVSSVKAMDCELKSVEDHVFCSHNSNIDRTNFDDVTLQRIQEVLYNCDIYVESAYKLTKPKASEFLGFMISDLDREYKAEQLHSIPIAYGLKGYSMPTTTLRCMIEQVLSECKQRGLYVPVCSFDGQWCRLVVRDREENPLTVLQLQKDVYASVRKMSKGEIIKRISQTNVITLQKEANMNDIIHLVNVEVTVSPKRIIVKTLKSGRALTISKHTWDMIIKNTHIPDDVLQEQDATNDLVGISTLPDNVIDQLTNDIAEDIQSATSASEDVNLATNMLPDPTVCVDTLFEQVTVTVNENDLIDETEHVVIAPAEESDETMLDEGDTREMLSSLQIDERANKNGKWNMNLTQFKEKMRDALTIDQCFLAYELQICLKPVIGKLKCKGVNVRLSSTKHVLVNILSSILGDGSTKQCKNKNERKGNIKTLKVLAKQAVQKISKEHLNVIIAENIFPFEISKWFQMSPFGTEIQIEGVDTTQQKCWYSRPDFNAPLEYYIFMILDAYHQICGLRRLVCSNGIPAAGITHKCWHKVAEKSEFNQCGLNTALVKDMIDRQSVAYAVQTFSAKVEKALVEIGAENEATVCNLIRNWYQAEDEPGISSIDRCSSRLKLRHWLLSNVNFGKFPPYGSHVNDIPIILYEGLLTGIERRLQLYPFTKTGTYNVRAVGSLDIENFFGSFQDIDP